MDEKFLEQYKKVYLKQKISDGDLQKSWDNLRQILPVRDVSQANTFFRYRYIFAGIILLMLIGTAGLAQAAKAGEILYPVKVLTNNVASKIFRTPQITEKKLEKNVTNPTAIPSQSKKQIKEDQKELKRDEKEIKEQNDANSNKSEADKRKQENEVKEAQTDNLENDNLSRNEKSEVNNQNTKERNQSDYNKENRSNNAKSNNEKNKNERD